MAERWKVRFSLRYLLVLVLFVAIGLAYYVRPSYYASAKMDFGVSSVAAKPGFTSALEDHCLRIRSPKIISGALSRYPELRDSMGVVNQVYERVRVVPDDSGVVAVYAFGEPNQKEELELLVKGIVESYDELLNSGPANLKRLDSDIEVKSGWGRDAKR